MIPPDLLGSELDLWVAKALGYVGDEPLCFHASKEIALSFLELYGSELILFADGWHATIRHGKKNITMVAKEPEIAIYRAFVFSRLSE